MCVSVFTLPFINSYSHIAIHLISMLGKVILCIYVYVSICYHCYCHCFFFACRILITRTWRSYWNNTASCLTYVAQWKDVQHLKNGIYSWKVIYGTKTAPPRFVDSIFFPFLFFSLCNPTQHTIGFILFAPIDPVTSILIAYQWLTFD